MHLGTSDQPIADRFARSDIPASGQLRPRLCWLVRLLPRVAPFLLLLACWDSPARADIFRWDNGQLIPGTEGITPGPGVQLDHRDLTNANLSNFDLTNSRFDFSNLEHAILLSANLTNGNLSGTNLTGALLGIETETKIHASTLTNANLTGAVVAPANFTGTTSHGFSKEQLYSTASDQRKNLAGIRLAYNDLIGWDFHGQDLTNADLNHANLASADLAGAMLMGAKFGNTTSRGFTKEQLYSAASYQQKSLQRIDLQRNNLTGWDFSGQNLTDAGFEAASLTGANLSGAILTGADFGSCTLENANFAGATLTNANLSLAELRGARGVDLSGATSRNAILPDGTIAGLDLAERQLTVRNYLGDPNQGLGPIPVTIQEHMVMEDGGNLQMLFDVDPWNSTISFEPGIPVALGGTLVLAFGPEIDLSTQVGRSFQLFDWSGVTPKGTFSTYTSHLWNVSHLYTTGEVTFIGVEGLAGDFNQNGVVDAADYVVWRHGLGTTYTQEYYNIWQANFGARLVTLSGATDPLPAAVPEPAGVVLLSIGLAVLARHSHRRTTMIRTRLGRFLWCVLVAWSVFVASLFYAITIDMVTVGNPRNAPDLRYNVDQRPEGIGAVRYEFQIGKYEVTAGQYTAFLNAVAARDTHGLYNALMDFDASDPDAWGCNITRTGSPGNYIYTVASDWSNRPVNYVSLWDAARFANWLHNGQPVGSQGPGTTEDGAYHNIGEKALFGREPNARFYIPTEDEWYNAAYHDKSAGLLASYFDYPMRSNTAPGSDVTESTNPGNNANYFSMSELLIGSPYYRTEVGEFEFSISPYGTFDQGGNVFEWTETKILNYDRGVRGGSFYSFSNSLRASNRYPVSYEDDFYFGFRLASIPEPSGDFNQNGVVDAADYAVWRNGLGTTYTQEHFDTWRANFGATLVTASGMADPLPASVPEPTGVVLLCVGLVALAMTCLSRGRCNCNTKDSPCP